MSITPLDIRKMSFPRKLRGLDPGEVERFLDLVAEELTARLEELERLQRENGDLRERVRLAERRQDELQEAVLHAQKLSQEITDQARREAEVLVREAGVTADSIVSQALEQANRIEGKVTELRTHRRDLQLKLRNTIDLFRTLLEADVQDERTTAAVHTLRPPERKQTS